METSAQQPTSNTQTAVNRDLKSHARIISREDSRLRDMIHKITSAVIAIFFYIFYMSYYQDGSVHKYLTIWGVVITMLTRIFALVHFFGNFVDSSRVTTVFRAMNSLHFTIELTITIFYWVALAPTDVPKFGNNGYKWSTNIFNHFCCFVLAAIAIGMERSAFEQRFFFYATLPIAIAYIIFMSIYVPVSGEYIYNVMTYKDGITALYIIIALLLMLASFYIGFWISRCNEKRWLKINGREEDLPPFRCFCWIIGKSSTSNTVASPNSKATGSPAVNYSGGSSPEANVQESEIPNNRIELVKVAEVEQRGEPGREA